ncbi:MAG: class I SAM-dependent methyltransferase [Chloroflexi bacterium]|nr:MAG: class I SAM-dependent methyltransferase [Chloroflexota bacterium]
MTRKLDIRAYNREAWDREVAGGSPWTIAVSPEEIARARRGEFSVLLTEQKPVPVEWFPRLPGLDVLCLAASGGQQAPILAAAGANVTVLDNSPRQLARDREVAEREGLNLTLVEGDMRDLSAFPAESFDLIFHPVSNVFVPDVRPVWKEAFRVLRHSGTLLSGFMNPVYYIFDLKKSEQGILEARHSAPYSDAESLSPAELEEYLQTGSPLEFGHTLTDQLGGQMDAGFHLIGLYEDYMPDSPLSKYHPVYIATRSLKP